MNEIQAQMPTDSRKNYLHKYCPSISVQSINIITSTFMREINSRNSILFLKKGTQ